MKPLIFVYGTLRRGGGHDLEKMFQDIRYIGEAEFQGEMALVDYFPGVIDSDDPENRVKGEIYELEGNGLSLKKLDEFEDFRAEDPVTSVYLRLRRQVKAKSGELKEVWIYLYNRPLEGFRKIGSGDFVRFLSEQSTGSME